MEEMRAPPEVCSAPPVLAGCFEQLLTVGTGEGAFATMQFTDVAPHLFAQQIG